MQRRRILLLSDAIRDVQKIYDDILSISKSKTVAQNYLKKLRHELRHLEFTAEACTHYVLDDGSSTDYRFCPACNYIAFFRLTENAIEIDRILYSRSDFIRHLDL